MSALHSIEVWLIALGLTTALLTGFGIFTRWCVLSPAVRADRLARLCVGMTTDEVTALLGRPREARTSPEGLRQWIYGSRMKRHVLLIEFTKQDTLQSFGHGVPGARRTRNPFTEE